jgi:hydroxypyruvate reductase/glycerate 2-kinase
MMLREHAQMIWRSAVDAVRPGPLLRAAVAEFADMLKDAPRIVVLGSGKAGTAMSVALEDALAGQLDKVVGWINVPAGTERPTKRIHLYPARPLGSNHPTEEGVRGSREILRLAREAGPDDVGLCLLSGGGSALLPAPAEGLTLADKQVVTQLLHACGATINEMNAVRKHLSAIKGGRLAEAFAGKALVSLILSDVIGDPLDVIASGPTAADPVTFAEVAAILERHELLDRVPPAVRTHIERGRRGEIPETPKRIWSHVRNVILGNNTKALAVAEATAKSLGYHVLNLGSFIEGETRQVAVALAGIVRSIRVNDIPLSPPACILSGGETTVTLTPNHGRGGRNQEFVLAMLAKLGLEAMRDVMILSGGTDGEDGPTDAAGALADDGTLARAARLGLGAEPHLARNDAYPFFHAAGDLLITGPTDTNVMDVRVILVR